jgi:hypothetical protein
MDRHDADALAPLFEDRGLGRLGIGLAVQPIDEAAERQAAHCFVGARQIGDAHDVSEDLLAVRPEDEPGVGARGSEKVVDRLLHWPGIAQVVEVTDQGKRPRNGHEVVGQRLAVLGSSRVRVAAAESVTPFEQLLVTDGEERALDGGEERQFVVGPLDRGERHAEALDFFS